MQVLCTTLGSPKKEKDLEILNYQTLVKPNMVISDIDNTLLDLLGGIEDHIKEYSREMQISYSFSNNKIAKIIDSKEIYSLFNKKGFFANLRPTKLLNMIKTREKYIGNLLIMTAEPSVDAFLEKVNLLSELLPDFKGTRIFMYEYSYKGQELAKRNKILKTVKENRMVLLEDNPDSLTYAFINGIETITLNHIYVLNHIKTLEKNYPRNVKTSKISVINDFVYNSNLD